MLFTTASTSKRDYARGAVLSIVFVTFHCTVWKIAMPCFVRHGHGWTFTNIYCAISWWTSYGFTIQAHAFRSPTNRSVKMSIVEFIEIFMVSACITKAKIFPLRSRFRFPPTVFMSLIAHILGILLLFNLTNTDGFWRWLLRNCSGRRLRSMTDDHKIIIATLSKWTAHNFACCWFVTHSRSNHARVRRT